MNFRAHKEIRNLLYNCNSILNDLAKDFSLQKQYVATNLFDIEDFEKHYKKEIAKVEKRLNNIKKIIIEEFPIKKK